jgi:hypothetical protein
MLQNYSIHLVRNMKQGISYLQIPKNKSQDQVLPPKANKCWNLWVEQVPEVVDRLACNLPQADNPLCKISPPDYKEYFGHRIASQMKAILQ